MFIPIGVRSSFRIKTNFSVPRLTWLSQMSTLLDIASYCLHSMSNMLLFKASICVYVSVQSCPTLCDPMDCSLPGSSVHRISQGRILEWVAISSSRVSSQPRDRIHISCVSCIGRQILYYCATWKALDKLRDEPKSASVILCPSFSSSNTGNYNHQRASVSLGCYKLQMWWAEISCMGSGPGHWSRYGVLCKLEKDTRSSIQSTWFSKLSLSCISPPQLGLPPCLGNTSTTFTVAPGHGGPFKNKVNLHQVQRLQDGLNHPWW